MEDDRFFPRYLVFFLDANQMWEEIFVERQPGCSTMIIYCNATQIQFQKERDIRECKYFRMVLEKQNEQKNNCKK